MAPDEPTPDTWSWSEEDDTAPQVPRRWLLLGAAAVPWVVVAAVLLRGATTGAPPHVVVSPTPVAAAPTPAGAGAGLGTPVPSATPPAGISDVTAPVADTVLARSAARHGVDVGDAITTAMLVTRAWFTGSGPQAEPADPVLGGGPTGYLEHAWVEAVDAPWRDHVVVTLGVVVLEPHDQGLVPVTARVAVPLAFDRDGARAAGSPYRLPSPEVRYEPLAFTTVDDPDQQRDAVDALSDAGYRVDALTELARSDGWPWLATFEGAGPGGGDPTTWHVWLRPHLGSFVVAGWLPAMPDDIRPTHDDQEVAP